MAIETILIERNVPFETLDSNDEKNYKRAIVGDAPLDRVEVYIIFESDFGVTLCAFATMKNFQIFDLFYVFISIFQNVIHQVSVGGFYSDLIDNIRVVHDLESSLTQGMRPLDFSACFCEFFVFI